MACRWKIKQKNTGIIVQPLRSAAQLITRRCQDQTIHLREQGREKGQRTAHPSP
jgi:hypothetical protein